MVFSKTFEFFGGSYVFAFLPHPVILPLLPSQVLIRNLGFFEKKRQ